MPTYRFLPHIFTIIIIALLPLMFAFSGNEGETGLKSELTKNLLADAENFKKSSAAYLQATVSEDSLKQSLGHLRNSYKKLEFLFNIYYPDYAEGHLNGAPLLHITRDGSRASVVPPEGLQKLDELVHSGELKNSKREVNQLAQQYVNAFNAVLRDFSKKKPTHSELIAAMRQQVITVFTLGITGFDTPGSARGIEESAHSLTAMAHFSDIYFKGTTLSGKFNEAAEYLVANSDFESFDRLYFLKHHADPLYAALLEVKSSRQITDLDRPTALNPNATGIFAQNFLDPYYFTELTKENDSPQLKELGSKLFYDPNLSFGSELSCASCHNPAMAFTDGRRKSLSNVEGQTVQRNAPTLLNAVYADRYFYDLRAFTLEQQAEHVIFNNLEFNTAYAEIVKNIEKNSSYKTLLTASFGDIHINRQRLTAALTSYVLSLQSFNSPFDKYARSETDTLDALAMAGFNLFMGKAACGTCHFAPTFAGLVPPQFQKSESEILGVLEKPIGLKPNLDADQGRNDNGVANEEAWIYQRSFKTASVRNVELTAPYFHNGAYSTLEQVMDFYNRGGGAGMKLDVANQTLAPNALNLSQSEIDALIAFMRSLTDNPYSTYTAPL